MDSKKRWQLLGLGFLSLSALRGALWWSYSQTPIPKSPLADPIVYRRLALAWARSYEMPPEAVFHPPLYPYLLGLVIRFFGDSVTPMLVLQNLLGILTGCLILAALLWTSTRARVFAFGLAFLLQSGAWIYYEWRLYPESLAINFQIIFLLGIWWLWADERWPRHRTQRDLLLFACGALFSIFILLRPNFILALPIIGFWSFLPSVRQKLGRAAAVSLFLIPAVCIVPVLVRNHRWGAGYAISANTGITFFQGNNANANGKYTSVQGVSPDILRQNEDVMRIASGNGARSIGEANHYWFNQGLSWWLSNPSKGINLALWKVVLFFSPEEMGGDIPFSFEKQQVPVLRWTSLISFFFVTFFALFGVKTLRRRNFPMVPFFALMGSSLATCVIFYVNNRYRAPAWPILLLVAAFGADYALSEWQRKSNRKRGDNPRIFYGASLLCGALLIVWMIPNSVSTIEEVVGWHNWGVSASRIELFPQAVAAYQEVLKKDPRHVPTLENLAFVYMKETNFKEAETTLNTLVKVDSSSYLGQLRMAQVKGRLGQWDQTIEYAQKAHALRPNEIDPLELEAEARFVTGDRKRACPMLSDIQARAAETGTKISTDSETYSQVCKKLADAGKLEIQVKNEKKAQ